MKEIDSDLDEDISSVDDSAVSTSGGDAGGDTSSGEIGGDTSTDDKNLREVRNLALKESKDVDTWRDLVTGVLVITACCVATASFIYLSKNESKTFKLAFQQYVITIEDSARDLEMSMNEGFNAVADSITAYAQTSESQFPFVTVPFFQTHSQHARDIAHVDSFALCPLVMEENRVAWEEYALGNQWWLQGDTQVAAYTEEQEDGIVSSANDTIPGSIYRFQNGRPTVDLGVPPYAPRWQMSPSPSDLAFINYDVISPTVVKTLYFAMVASNGPVMSGILGQDHSLPRTSSASTTDPASLLLFPVYKNFNDTATDIAAFLEVLFDWKTFVSYLLPEGEGNVYYVVNSTCGDEFTFKDTGRGTVFLGEGDHHDINYDRYVAYVDLVTHEGDQDHSDPCLYGMSIYPSSELRQEFSTSIPGIFTGVVALAFFLMAFFFFAYDKFVQRRNDKIMRQAAKTNAIVSSLFPTNVRDRLFGNDNASVKSGKTGVSSRSGGRSRLKNFLSDSSTAAPGSSREIEDRPIADLFPNCTVSFADIAGFTAWSSMREPAQVFTLLEKIYAAFDEIAKRRKVFKVETIGDCYVAVTGLPEPNKHHALTMGKFARDAMIKMHQVTRDLEVTLGPDTGDLSMRFGLHSGPVTAGVLRGERSRFQLFGDTVNTAARVESTGMKGCIHLSQEAADEISASGKAIWVKQREDKVQAKGKGEMTTFWLSLAENSSSGDAQSSCGDSFGGGMLLDAPDKKRSTNMNKQNGSERLEAHGTYLSDKNQRLVEWNVDILLRLLKQIAAKRRVTKNKHALRRTHSMTSDTANQPQMVLEEVVEVICLPKFTAKTAGIAERAEDMNLSSDVILQLRSYVASIAAMYNDNPFHNFEHASHVCMSVVKLLSRIVAPDLDDDMEANEYEFENEMSLMKSLASKMHDHTFGITSDPLTQFACVISALIHDVDHVGVPNAQLVKEKSHNAIKYQGKSVAEQNSVDLAWGLLLKDDYKELRQAICGDENDWTRFRQLVVNSVMATDIVDRELKELRNARWDKAFKGEFKEEDPITDRNRKATVVIEHLIQASDISHTMQHWHIYRKWNERLFFELYRSYKEGRAEKDPSEFWYKGEIGFFTFYIIPLAKKLKECGVFGVSSDEYLNYAENNLAEWKTRGEQVVAEMVEKVKEEYGK